MTDDKDRDLEEATLHGIVGGAGVSITKPKTDDWTSSNGGGEASLPSMPPHPMPQLLGMEMAAAEQKMHDAFGGHHGSDTHHGVDGAAEQKAHHGDPKAETAEQKLHDAEQKLHDADPKLHGIDQKMHGIDQKAHDGDLKGQTPEQRLHDAEQKLHGLGDKTNDADHKRPDADLKKFEAEEQRIHEKEAALAKQHGLGVDGLGPVKGPDADHKTPDPSKMQDMEATLAKQNGAGQQMLQDTVNAVETRLNELKSIPAGFGAFK